jgi:N-acetylglutamate synthase-like GNAT family acetyltransferase
MRHELVTPTTASEWAAYHAIRRQVLFAARGQVGVYDENHPDETAPNNHPKILAYHGEAVGVVRVDIDGKVATLRRVAIRADVQGRGHGRVLLQLAQQFAERAGCTRLASFVALDAVGFYQGFGFSVEEERALGPSRHESVFMIKELVLPAAG